MDDGGIEATRLYTLKSYCILDTEPEAAFDQIVGEAVAKFGTPIALISLVDERRLWFKARIGIDAQETDRSVSFCTHTIETPDILVVADARADDRFSRNPLVTEDPGIRFYAGAPLTSPNGARIGTLCVIDGIPRPTLDQAELDQLSRLAGRTMEAIEKRKASLAHPAMADDW